MGRGPAAASAGPDSDAPVPSPREKDMAVRVGDWGGCGRDRSGAEPCLLHALLLLPEPLLLPLYQLQPSLLLLLYLPGLAQRPLPLLELLGGHLRGGRGSAGRAVWVPGHAPRSPAAGHLAHALHLLGAEPGAQGSGADPLLLQLQLLSLPLQGLPLGRQLLLLGSELTGPDL